ncbi:MAG TPA: hypothetical protein VFS39_18395 [Nitrospira sp.]|nr:hypothetical protein [Nitrospira sp.]
MLSVHDIRCKVDALKQAAHTRDQRHADILAVRSGEVEKAFPDMFSSDYPKPVIANFIDIAARDTAETLAPLPAFNCSATNMVSDAARKRADKRTKGAAYYIQHSRLQTQMYRGADWYGSFGFMPILVEPDYDAKCPRLTIESPLGAYPEFDRWGRCISFTRRVKKRISELCAEWPEYARYLAGPSSGYDTNGMLEVVLYRDADQTILFVPERANLVLSQAEQRLGECPMSVARRPGVDDDMHGAYDDVLWVQLARHRFAMLAMEAAELSVEAPLALPLDVQTLEFGPHATLRSNSPEKIRKVATELPQGAFAEGQLLDQELRVGARYPGVRTGQSPASSIVTGNAVQELGAGFDSQIKATQDVFVETFTNAMRMAFKLDETYWPDVERGIKGNSQGVPYEIQWKPSRDIAGDHSIDVTYGFAMGLDPNRSLVFLLQLLGGRLVSKDMVRRQFPFGVDVTQEEQRIEIEELRDALVQSVAAYAQSIPVLAQQGMDPSEPLMRITQIIKGRQRGKALEDVISESFAPTPPPGLTPGSSPGPGGPGEMSPGGGPNFPPPGLRASGLPVGVAPGQAQMGPGGAPDLMTMLAGLNSGGGPTTNVNVKRSLPA